MSGVNVSLGLLAVFLTPLTYESCSTGQAGVPPAPAHVPASRAQHNTRTKHARKVAVLLIRARQGHWWCWPACGTHLTCALIVTRSLVRTTCLNKLVGGVGGWAVGGWQACVTGAGRHKPHVLPFAVVTSSKRCRIPPSAMCSLPVIPAGKGKAGHSCRLGRLVQRTYINTQPADLGTHGIHNAHSAR